MYDRMILVRRVLIGLGLVVAIAFAGQSMAMAGEREIVYYQSIIDEAAAAGADADYEALTLEVADMTNVAPECAPLAANVLVWLIYWDALWEFEPEFETIKPELLQWQPPIQQPQATACLGAR